MIVSRITDGFGNQLFMYACGYAVSKRVGTQLSLDTTVLDTNPIRKLEIDKLNIIYERLFTVDKHQKKWMKILHREWIHRIYLKKYVKFKEKIAFVYDETIENVKDDTNLIGYWQSEKYFKDYRSDLIKLFSPNYELSPEAKKYMEAVKKCNSIAIHVRLGDYQAAGNCLNIDYYIKAIKIMKKYSDDLPTFFVFSDDIDTARKQFQEIEARFVYVKYISSNLTLDDFFIMKNCKSQIIANSSFSWWAAWLNEHEEKVVICPEKDNWKDDFYPKEWVKIICD